MKNSDNSKEILDKYYNPNGRFLLVQLKDGTVLEGILIGYFHGDREADEPYIVKWHFVDKKDIARYRIFVSVDGSAFLGRIINQEDIKSVRFSDEEVKATIIPA